MFIPQFKSVICAVSDYFVSLQKQAQSNHPTMNLIKQLTISLTAALLPACVQSQRHEILNERIASLQVVPGDNWLSPLPIVELNGATPILIAFDDLTHDYHRYAYRLEHCEADWTASEGLFESDFVDGFAKGNVIEDLSLSMNTDVLYTHYRLQIPNERCRIKRSGNYRLTVYDENNGDEIMFRACFMVVEPQMSVAMKVTSNTDIDLNHQHQQVAMDVGFGSLNVIDPAREIKTVVMQNGRWDDARINTKPQYVRADGLTWDHDSSLIFNGGNEYRKFETLDVNHPTMGIESINWDGTMYHAYVWTDEPRPNYVYDEDADGAFYIRNSDNIENDYASEYLMIHFRLKAPRQKGDVYLNGTWTNHQFAPSFQMHYDDVKQCYEGRVMLKQGYYSYQYLVVKADGTVGPVSTEGNFYQTENQYQALVYYRGVGERTDRLVGFGQVSKR